MIVMKFGGTSVADNDAMGRSIDIVGGRLDRKPVVVVSALSKVTDTLYKIYDAALAGDRDTMLALISGIADRHYAMCTALIADADRASVAAKSIGMLIDSLTQVAQALLDSSDSRPQGKAHLLGFGELLSSTLMCYVMNARGIRTTLLDARSMLITNSVYLKAEPDIAEIEARAPGIIAAAMADADAVITQGFIAADHDGQPTILGRGGSDYSASLIGMAIDADVIEIWTDVDGVRTADPRRVANTRSIDRISFEEAAQLAHFGAKVLHPQSIEPAVSKDIPVYVLNSMNPSAKGTAILGDNDIADGVKSVSYKENILMLNIFSPRMVDVPGFLSRVFAVFAAHNVSVDLISTSEANISLTVEGSQDVTAVIEQLSEMAEVRVFDDKAQVSIIGKNVVKQRGMLRWAMTALNNTETYMISQDASLVNISLVIRRSELDEVLLELHRHFFEFE